MMRAHRRGRKPIEGLMGGASVAREPMASPRAEPQRRPVAASVSTLVTTRPRLVVIAFVLVTILMVPGVLRLEIKVDIADYFPNSPVINADDDIQELFPPTGQSVAIVALANDGRIDAKEIRGLALFEDALWADERVRSYVDVPRDEAFQSVLSAITPALASRNLTLASVDDVTLDATLDAVLQDPRVSALMADDRSSALLVLQTRLTDGAEEDQVAVRTVAQHFREGGIEPKVAGAFIQEMNDSSIESLRILLPIALVLLIVVLALTLRRLLDAILVFAMIPMVFVWLAGSITYLHLTFSQLTFFAPILLLALGVDDGLHLLHRYREEGSNGNGPTTAMGRSISAVGLALFLTTITTSAAFASNLVSSISAIRDFGLALALGMAYALVANSLLLPALRLLIASGRETASHATGKSLENRRPPGWLVRSTIGVAKRGPLVVLMVVALTLPAVWMGSTLQSSLRNADLVADDADVIVAFEALDNHYGSVGFNNALVLVRGPIDTLRVLQAIDDVSRRAADDEHIARIGGQIQLLTAASLVRELMADPEAVSALDLSDGNGDGLPDDDDHVTIVFHALLDDPRSATVAASVLHRDDHGRYDATVLRFSNVDVKGTIEQKEVLDEVTDDVRSLQHLDSVEVTATGSPVIFHELLTDISDSMVSSVIISIIVVTLMLIVVFRSLRLGLIGVLPVILVAIWILATMRLLGLSLNVVTVTVTSMTIGVGVDYAIHIIQRYREELGRGESHEGAVTLSLQHSGSASVGAAASTGLGFMVLAFSPMNMFATFGILSTLMLAYSLLATVVLIPSLLLLTGGGSSRRRLGPRLPASVRRNRPPALTEKVTPPPPAEFADNPEE